MSRWSDEWLTDVVKTKPKSTPGRSTRGRVVIKSGIGKTNNTKKLCVECFTEHPATWKECR